MIAFFMLYSSVFAQDVKELNLDEARTECIKDIKSVNYGDIKTIDVEECRLLAWYREHDEEATWYRDNALFWAKVLTEKGIRWALVHMARCPLYSLGTPKWESQYARVYPFDRWFLFFDHPPTARDVYEKMYYFKFEVTQNDEYWMSTN